MFNVFATSSFHSFINENKDRTIYGFNFNNKLNFRMEKYSICRDLKIYDIFQIFLLLKYLLYFKQEITVLLFLFIISPIIALNNIGLVKYMIKF